MRCLSLTSPLLKLDNQSTVKFISNCAIFMRNANNGAGDASELGKLSADPYKLAINCVACLPGFKPITTQDLSGKILPLAASSCVEISNCADSQWFNSCSKCALSYTYAYLNEEVDYG